MHKSPLNLLLALESSGKVHDVNDHHSLDWTLLCQKLMAVSIYSKNSQEHSFKLLVLLVCSTNTALLNPVCWTTTVPDDLSQWQKGFWKVTLLDIIILLSMYSEHQGASGTARDPTAPNAVPAQKSHKPADICICHKWGNKKQVVKEGVGKVLLKKDSL